MRGKSIGNGKELVKFEDLARLQSVVATHEKPEGLSGKYRFFSTMQIVEALANEGWMPVFAQEQWCRNVNGQGYQKHLVRLRQMQYEMAGLNKNDVLPELCVTNSHNGLSRYHLLAALMRLICTNGLVVSGATFGEISFVHKGFMIEDVLSASQKIIAGFDSIAAHVLAYQSIELDNAAALEFARLALALRFNAPAIEEKGLIKIENRIFSPDELLTPVRSEDEKRTLWNVFNIIQEKVTKGSKFERTMYISETINEGVSTTRTISRAKVKGIESINTNLTFNRGLWNLMENTRKAYLGHEAEVIDVTPAEDLEDYQI